MAQQNINIGTNANDGTGDPLRTAFNKINSNFTELYTSSPFGKQVTITGNQITANASNADLVLSGSGTGGVTASGLRFGGTSISADDSSIVNINEGLNVTGNITAEGDITATGNAAGEDIDISLDTTFGELAEMQRLMLEKAENQESK